MTIERLSFPEGISLGERGDIDRLIRDVVKQHKSEAVILPEGRYILNPPSWPKSLQEFVLETSADGGAIYYEPISQMENPFGELGEMLQQVRKHKIPEDRNSVALAGILVSDGKPDLRLFEYISHASGPAPQK